MKFQVLILALSSAGALACTPPRSVSVEQRGNLALILQSEAFDTAMIEQTDSRPGSVSIVKILFNRTTDIVLSNGCVLKATMTLQQLGMCAYPNGATIETVCQGK